MRRIYDVKDESRFDDGSGGRCTPACLRPGAPSQAGGNFVGTRRRSTIDRELPSGPVKRACWRARPARSLTFVRRRTSSFPSASTPVALSDRLRIPPSGSVHSVGEAAPMPSETRVRGERTGGWA
jgi:hypothetical protein